MHLNYRLSALILAIVVLVIGGIGGSTIPRASAMGPPSSACSNLYYGNISDFQIISPGNVSAMTTDVSLTSATTTIVVPQGSFYNVVVTVDTLPTSVSGNTTAGQIWYSSDANNFKNSACTPVDGPGTSSLSFYDFQYCCEAFTGIQHVTWDTLDGGQSNGVGTYSTVSYNIDWVPSNVTTTSTSTTTKTILSVSTTTDLVTSTATNVVTSLSTTTLISPPIVTTRTMTTTASGQIGTSTATVTSTKTIMSTITMTTSVDSVDKVTQTSTVTQSKNVTQDSQSSSETSPTVGDSTSINSSTMFSTSSFSSNSSVVSSTTMGFGTNIESIGAGIGIIAFFTLVVAALLRRPVGVTSNPTP